MRLSTNKLAAFVGAVAAPCLTLLVDQHALTPLLATDVGAVIFTAVAFLHINNDEARAAIATLASLTTPIQAAVPAAAPSAPAPAPAPVIAVPAPAPTPPADVLAVDPAVPSAL